MEEKMLRLLEPYSEPRKLPARPLAPRAGDLNGKMLGFLSNMWPSLPYTFKRFEELARERYRISGTITKQHATSGAPASEEAISELSTKADAVIVALGN